MADPNKTGFMCSPSTLSVIKAIKDSAGQPIAWSIDPTGKHRAGLVVGHPVFLNPDVPSPAAGGRSLLFGSFPSVLVRDVGGMSFARLVERYAEASGMAVLAHVRGDAVITDASAVKCLEHPNP